MMEQITNYNNYLNQLNTGGEVMTWEIFLGIAALVSFVVVICKPLIELSKNITKLDSSLISLTELIKRIDVENENNHKRLWEQ